MTPARCDSRPPDPGLPPADREPPDAADARLIIAASEANADLYYATRFLAPDPFVFLWHGAEKILLMSDLELDRARAQAEATAVLSLAEYERRASDGGVQRPQPLDALAVLLAERGVRTLQVPGTFPVEHADGLRERGYRLSVKPAPFFEERPIKTEAEVTAIRRSMQRTEAALGAAIQAIRDAEVRGGLLWWQGEVLTSERLKRFLAMALLADGMVAQHTIVACGNDGCDPHHQGAGPLRAGETIILDVFPQDAESRYFADITRTVVKGKAPEEVRRMYQAVLEAQAVALERIRGGAEGEQIHREVQAALERHGFATGEVGGRRQGFFHGTGHGIGLEIHELPRIAQRPMTLAPGHVVTVEPGLYYPGVGGVRIEDVVVVTATGCENLTTFPKLMEV